MTSTRKFSIHYKMIWVIL